MGLCEGRWSEGLVREAVWLSGQAPFEHVEGILQRLRGLSISDSSIWRRVQGCGARFGALEERQGQEAMMPPARWEPARGPRMGAAMDGTMVHLRGEGWKEVKVGSVYQVGKRVVREESTGELVIVGEAQQTSYVGHLGGPEVFGELMWAEARRRGWLKARDSQVIGDGAPWIWNLAGLHFGESLQLVDWYHAVEHLAVAARMLHGEGTPEAKRWLRQGKERLYQGQAAAIAQELWQERDGGERAEALNREAGYFQRNQHRMSYMEMREEEWPIGSGPVESAAKQIQQRLGGPGMMWSRPGAEHMLPIRTAIMSNRFDELWYTAYHPPPN